MLIYVEYKLLNTQLLFLLISGFFGIKYENSRDLAIPGFAKILGLMH